MRYVLSHARVDNAKPLYYLRDEDGRTWLYETVESVALDFLEPLWKVRQWCKTARENGVVEFTAK